MSRNRSRACWVLKCDIRKFFASIDHKILFSILASYIPDKNILSLFQNIIDSFETIVGSPVGLPLGNLTSQLLANVYMNHLDQWVKHVLKAKHYIRYADDFVFLSHQKNDLEDLLPRVDSFLKTELKLSLHPGKIFLRTFTSGVDFLGWVHFSDHRILRDATKRRALRRIKDHATRETFQSYLGLLTHGATFKVEQDFKQLYWLWHDEV